MGMHSKNKNSRKEYNIRYRVNYETNLNRSVGYNAKAARPPAIPPSKTPTPPTKTPVTQDGHQRRRGIGMLSRQLVMDHLLGPTRRSPQVSSKAKAKRELKTVPQTKQGKATKQKSKATVQRELKTEFQMKRTTKQNQPKSKKRGRSEITTIHEEATVDTVEISNSHLHDKKNAMTVSKLSRGNGVDTSRKGQRHIAVKSYGTKCKTEKDKRTDPSRNIKKQRDASEHPMQKKARLNENVCVKPRSISDLNVILAGKKQRQKSNPIANLNLFLKGDNTDHGHDLESDRIQQDTSSRSKSVLIPSTALKEPSDCNVVALQEGANTDSYKVPSSSSSVSTSTSDKKSAGNHRHGLLVHKNLETESHGSSKGQKKLTFSELNETLPDKKQNQKSNPTATMNLFLKGDHLSHDNDVDVDIIHLKSSKMSKSTPSPSFLLKDPNDSDGTVNADCPKLSSSTPHVPSSASSFVVLPLNKSSGSHQADVPVHEISELVSSNAKTDTSGQVKKCVNQNYDTDLNISPTCKGYPKEVSAIAVLNLPLQSSNDHEGARLNHDVLRIEKNAPNYSQKNSYEGEIIYRRDSETTKNVPIESLKLYPSPSMASFIMTNEGKSRFDLTASNDDDHEGDIIQHDTSKMSKAVPSPSIEWTDPSDSEGTTMPEDANIDSHKVQSSPSPVSYVATSDSDKKSAGNHRPNLLMHAKLKKEPRYYEGKKINTNENIRYTDRIDIPNATHQGTKTTSRRSIHSSQEIHLAHTSKVNSNDSDISSEVNDAKLLSFPILRKASALLIDQAYIESYLFKVLERNQSDIAIDVASFLINDARGKNNKVDTNLSLVLQITRVLLTAMGFDHNSPKRVCHSLAPVRPLQKKTTERASAVKHIVCLQIAILKASTEERKCSLMEEIALAYRMACHFMLVSVEALLEYHRTDPRKTRSLTKLKMRATLTMVVSLRDLLAGLMKDHTSPNVREVKGCAVNDNISNFFSCEPGQSFNGAEILVVDCVGLLIESECENKMKDTKRTMKVAETLLKLGKAGSKSLVISDGIMEFLFRRILIQEVENKVPGLPLQRHLLRLRNRYDAKTGALASTLCQMTPTCRRTLEDITLLRQNQSSLIRVREEFIGQSCNNHCSPPPVLDPTENTDAIAKREIEILRIEGCMYLAQVIDVYNASSGTSRNAGLAVSSQHVSNMAFYFFHTLMENDPQYYKSEAISIRLRVNLEPAVLSSLYLATKVVDCAINMTDIIQFSKQVSQANAIFSDKVFPERRPYRKLIKKYEQHLMILHSYYVPGINIIPISKIADVSEYLGLDHRNDSRFKHVFNNIGYTFSTSCLIDDPLLVAFAVYHFGSEHLNVLERYLCWNDLFENESRLRIEVISSHMNSIFTRYQGSHCNSKENLSSTPELMQDITPLKVTLEEMDTL